MTEKIDFVNDAYSKMRISGLTVNPSPEDLTLALFRLESLMYELEDRSICMNYNFEEEPDLTSPTNVQNRYRNGVSWLLAEQLGPDFNKPLPAQFMKIVNGALSSISSFAARENIREISAPNRQPLGSGTDLRYNKYQRFFREESLPPLNCQTKRMLLDDINTYEESFAAYLGDETISSFETTVDDGLTLESSSNTDTVITYTIKAGDNATDGSWQQLRLTITTSSGRVKSRLINFQLCSKDTVNNN